MKGNPILGTGSGSIGDVTIMRRNGSQVTRVRLRKIKNPKSQGQAEQRMINAEVAKFYSPLAGVLETSFEGLGKADSYAKFLSINMNLARANGWGAKKGDVLPFPFQISAGSLPQPEVAGGTLITGEPAQGVTPATLGEISALIIAKYDGLQNGDQVTCISWSKGANNNVWSPKFTRFYLDTASTDALPNGITWGRRETGILFDGAEEHAAFIFSRWNGEKWARSTSFVYCEPDVLETWTDTEEYAAAIASYMKSAGQTPVSDVYLNGSDD